MAVLLPKIAFTRLCSMASRSTVPHRTVMKGLHPRRYPATLVLSDGSTISIKTAAIKTDVIKLPEDIRNQAPWSVSDGLLIDTDGQIAKFEARNKGQDFDVPIDDDEW